MSFRRFITGCALVGAMAGSASAQEATEEADDLKLTAEVNLGLGALQAAPHSGERETELAPLGLGVGVGALISPKVALTLRGAGVVDFTDDGKIISAFLGPSLQAWFHESAWLGVGIGVGGAKLFLDDLPDPDLELGLAFDVRLGVTLLVCGKRSLNVSLEATPVLLEGGSLYGASLLVGYQYL